MANITIASSASAVPAQPELYVQDGIVTTSSLQVAHFFGKRHTHVLRAIKNLLSEMPEGYAPNFEPDTGGSARIWAMGAHTKNPCLPHDSKVSCSSPWASPT